MRKLLGVAVLCLSLSQVIGQPVPTCDGTSPVKIKCTNGVVPKGYFESQTCDQGIVGNNPCSNSIAFNIDYFGCSQPTLDTTTTPPSYTSYCVDGTSLPVSQCTVASNCVGINVINNGIVGPTTCAPTGAPMITNKLIKTTINCTRQVPIPVGAP